MKKKTLIILGLIVVAGGIVFTITQIRNNKTNDKYLQYETSEVRNVLDNKTSDVLTEYSQSQTEYELISNSERAITNDEFGIIWNLVLPYTSNFSIDDCIYDIATQCYIVSTEEEYVVIDLDCNEVYYTKLKSGG